MMRAFRHIARDQLAMSQTLLQVQCEITQTQVYCICFFLFFFTIMKESLFSRSGNFTVTMIEFGCKYGPSCHMRLSHCHVPYSYSLLEPPTKTTKMRERWRMGPRQMAHQVGQWNVSGSNFQILILTET